jgi:hypothetical protein
MFQSLKLCTELLKHITCVWFLHSFDLSVTSCQLLLQTLNKSFYIFLVGYI